MILVAAAGHCHFCRYPCITDPDPLKGPTTDPPTVFIHDGITMGCQGLGRGSAHRSLRGAPSAKARRPAPRPELTSMSISSGSIDAERVSSMARLPVAQQSAA